jgi:hypothetical protein
MAEVDVGLGGGLDREPGELERAEAWGRALAIKVAPQPVARV